MPQKEEALIILEDLTKQYYEKNAVNNINLKIPSGCFALLGPNGAGKTTLILLLLVLIQSTKGKVYIMGNDVSKKLDRIRKTIGYIAESVGFYPFFNRSRSC